ncbi:MAG: YceD family protein [Pseudomonadota bacterium]
MTKQGLIYTLGRRMTNDLPLRFDPALFAKQGRQIEGDLAIRDMPRIVDLTHNLETILHVTMVFSKSSLQFPLVKGTIQGQVVQICQRCLGDVAIDIDQEFELLLVGPDSTELASQEGHELFEYQDQYISTIELIEDETILALPIVAKHKTLEECDAVARKWIEEKEYKPADIKGENPFASLKNLKT